MTWICRAMRPSLLCLVLLIFGAVPEGSAQLTSEGGPIDISADEGSLDTTGRRVTYRGNVVVVQGAARLVANELTVDYAPTPSAEISADALVRIRAAGNVTYTTAEENVRAGKCEYVASSNTLTLEGDVVLVNPGGEARGTRMVVTLDDGRWTLYGDTSGRVTTTISPDRSPR